MMAIQLAIFCCICCGLVFAQTESTTITITPEPEILELNATILQDLLQKLNTTGHRMPCDSSVENQFYERISRANEEELKEIITEFGSNLTRICNRFQGLICENDYNEVTKSVEDRCVCGRILWWDETNEYCAVPIHKECATWLKVRKTHKVPTRFANLNQPLGCVSGTFCGGRGLCICPAGSVCDFTVSGTVKEKIHTELRDYFSTIISKRMVGRFLNFGDSCDPKYHFYRPGEQNTYGFDYPKLRAFLEKNISEVRHTDVRYCDILNFHACRNDICQCQRDYLSEGVYECKGIENQVCSVHAWFQSNWYRVGSTGCFRSIDSCKGTNDGLDNQLCCPIVPRAESDRRCHNRTFRKSGEQGLKISPLLVAFFFVIIALL